MTSSFERTPLYAQLAQAIREKEIAGKAPGEPLPSEPELTAKYSVSRTTVRKAIELLERQNLVRRRQGSGTYIQDQQLPERDIALLMEIDIAAPGVSPSYPRLLQEVRMALFKEGQSSRPYLGYGRYGAELDTLTCGEIMRDLNLNRISGMISIVANPHISWVSEFRKRSVVVVGGNRLMDHLVEVNKTAMAHQIFASFAAAGKRRVALLNWRHGTEDDSWFTEELARAYGLSMLDLRIPLGCTSPSIPTQELRRVVETVRHSATPPDCLMAPDDLVFAGCQRALFEGGIHFSAASDVVVYGSDAVEFETLIPLTRYLFSVKTKAQLLAGTMMKRLKGLEAPATLEVPLYIRTFSRGETLNSGDFEHTR